MYRPILRQASNTAPFLNAQIRQYSVVTVLCLKVTDGEIDCPCEEYFLLITIGLSINITHLGRHRH